METVNNSKDIVAKGPTGPEGLEGVFAKFRELSQTDPTFTQNHYILYQLGQQESLLKVNFDHAPPQFWYSDTKGRPITNPVKEAIANFTNGDAEVYDYHTLKLDEKVKATLEFEIRDLSESHNIETCRLRLDAAIADNAWHKAAELQALGQIKIPELTEAKGVSVADHPSSFFRNRAKETEKASKPDFEPTGPEKKR